MTDPCAARPEEVQDCLAHFRTLGWDGCADYIADALMGDSGYPYQVIREMLEAYRLRLLEPDGGL